MAKSLEKRQLGYEEQYAQCLLPKVPVIIKIDGRGFSSVTKNVPKPFCHKTAALLNGTMLNMAKQIDGVVFGYQYSDKIILVLKNDRSRDEDPWFNNNIQDIVSTSSSLATYEFMSQLWQMDDDPPPLDGIISFKSKAFCVPTIAEAINYLIFRQFRCITGAVNKSAQVALWPKHREQTFVILDSISIEEKKKIIKNEGIDWDTLPHPYRMGSGVYLTPRLISISGGSQITRHKWVLDFELPLFEDPKSRDTLKTILTTGSDIFRPQRDLDGSE